MTHDIQLPAALASIKRYDMFPFYRAEHSADYEALVMDEGDWLKFSDVLAAWLSPADGAVTDKQVDRAIELWFSEYTNTEKAINSAMRGILMDFKRSIYAAPPADSAMDVLQKLLDRYTSLVNCGDCGFWDPETEPEVIAARALLAGRK